MIKKIIIITAFVLLSGTVAVGAIAWYTYKHGTLQTFLVHQAVDRFTPEEISKPMLHKVLGFEEVRTYLVLFLNNTEIRPGGGFIGSYAVVRFESGVPHIVKVEGSEIIDNFAPNAYFTPPDVLEKYLFIKKWQFRDSNWSPDFPTSASTSLALYRLENGAEFKNIDGVIAFTPSVIEELLKITGPLELDGEKYTSENFTQKLEYEVEYGFKEKGIAFRDRKQIMTDLSHQALGKIRSTLLSRWSDYRELVPHMLAQKHIMLYSLVPDEQRFIEEAGWSGEMKTGTDDYILWADANLGALKTDASMNRALSYTIAPSGTTYVATVTMHYDHKGVFDKFTTRYRDYARVFVPAGSRLIETKGVMRGDKDQQPGVVGSGVENGRQWFGGFISIEPGKSWDLTFRYELAPSVVTAIKNGTYTLLVQKQLGMETVGLTLGAEFGTKVSAAEPAENSEYFGDSAYNFKGDLVVDRVFRSKF